MPEQDMTPTEAGVMRMWTELLGTAPASVHEDFFTLGGDSLALVRFLARVQDGYGVELPVEALFAAEFTVARAAHEIDQRLLDEVDADELDALLAEVDALSDDEVRALLAEGA